MNKYKDIMGRINYVLFLVVVFLLPFPQIALRYGCVLWIATWLFEGRWVKSGNWRLNTEDWRKVVPFVLFSLWYGWRLLSGLWAPDHAAWSSQMERYITFGAIVPVALWGVNEHYNWRQIGNVFIFSCLCAVFFYPAVMTLLLHHREIIDNHPFLHALWDYSSFDWFHFYQTNISQIKHRLFLCSVELFGAYLAFILYRNRLKILLPILLLIVFFIAMSGSRQILITTSAVITAIAIFSIANRYHEWYAVGIVLAGLALGGALLVLHPRMKDLSTISITQIQHYETDDFARLNTWQVALQEPQDYLLRGLGGGQSTPYLVEHYTALGLDSYAAKRYNCHNQYLEELMELGIFGLLLFVLAWLAIPICVRKERRQTAWVFVLLFLFNMVTECMFGRFCGIALWAVGMVLIYCVPTPQPHSAPCCREYKD